MRNIGDIFSGKEVVEIYAEPPVGKLAKPIKSLAAFAKARELAPGEEQHMTVSFSARRLASYNEDTSEWVIEKGCYVMALGNSSDNLKEFAVVDVSADIVCERCKALFRGEKVGELHPAMIICGMPFSASNGVVSPAAPGMLFEAMPITLDFPLLILAEPTQSTAAS